MTGKRWIYPGYFLPASKIADSAAGEGKIAVIDVGADSIKITNYPVRKIDENRARYFE